MTTPDEAPTAGDPIAARQEKLLAIAALGVDPWGGRFEGRQFIDVIRDRASEIAFRKQDGTLVPLPDFAAPPDGFEFRGWLAEQGPGEMVGPTVRAAGRIVLQRTAGKLRFVDIRDMTGQIQLFIGKAQVGDDWELSQHFDLGDLIGVDGTLKRTKTGELSIFAQWLHFLTKSLEPPPEKYHGLTDPELRQRMRYLDLIHGEGVMDTFLRRSQIVRSIRNSLHERGYVEVEGPTLHAIAGGAAAKPFKTHHNALDIDLYLRIALELHLKRLLVGGIEKVFELGRVYRNEGISPRHNPEFTMLELYEAYGDYRSMMELTEAVIVEAILASRWRKPAEDLAKTPAGGWGRSQQAQPPAASEKTPAADATGSPFVLPWGDKTIDFSPPFQRRTYDDLFAEHTHVDPHNHAAIAKYAATLGIVTAGRHPDVIKSDVFEMKVEDALAGPIFVMDYPASICPLTKRKRDNPAVAERFELIVQGMEIANAYTELNDPELQEQLFKTQLAGHADEDSMAKMDHDFIRALRHGMPPAGGLGIGIDRLVMLLTNSQSIREVILFPLLRPER